MKFWTFVNRNMGAIEVLVAAALVAVVIVVLAVTRSHTTSAESDVTPPARMIDGGAR